MLEQNESQESMALKVHKILDGFKAFLSELLVSSSDSIEYNSIHVAPLFQPLESIASRSRHLVPGLDISLSVSAVGVMMCRSVQIMLPIQCETRVSIQVGWVANSSDNMCNVLSLCLWGMAGSSKPALCLSSVRLNQERALKAVLERGEIINFHAVEFHPVTQLCIPIQGISFFC